MIDIRFPGGRPVLVITDPQTLEELAGLVDAVSSQAVHRGQAPIASAQPFVAAARRVVALHQVAQPQPARASDTPPTGRWISTQEAAQRLGVSQAAITKRARKGQLGARRIGGRWLIDMKELDTNAAA